MSAILSESSTVAKVPLTPVNQNIKFAVVGTTNIGKSLLLNLITRTSQPVEVTNALFTTVDPSTITFKPYDAKLDFFKGCVPTITDIKQVCFTGIDSPGLVENCFLEGVGLGVSAMKNVAHADILMQLVKCFESRDVASYDEENNSLKEFLMVEQELLLMDLNKVESILSEVESVLAACPATETLIFQQETLVQVWEHLAGTKRPIPIPPSRKKGSRMMSINRVKLPEKCLGSPVRLGTWDSQQREVIQFCKLLTAKEIIYLANLTSLDFLRGRVPRGMQSIQEYLSKRSDTAQLMTISLELEQRMYEAEVAGEGELYHSINASHRSVLPSIIEEVYRTLQLIRFYIVDDKRAHTYVCRHGTTAADAANLVDVYVSRNFIRAEVISFEEYELMAGDRLKLAMEGKIRPQGRKYVFNDGDIVEFVFHTKSETV